LKTKRPACFRLVLPVTQLLSAVIVPGRGSERRERLRLTHGQLVASDYNDGDRSRIRSRTNEFMARLYLVGAPEINLRYAARNREQAEHFGVTLDETIKAGAQTRDAVHPS
jgi:hypothetical protein